jgi:hypothetical protein
MAIFTAVPPKTVTFVQNMLPNDASFVRDEPYAVDDKNITVPEPNSGIEPIFEVNFGNLGSIEGQIQIEYVFVDFVNAGARIEMWENTVFRATSPMNYNGEATAINSAFFDAGLLLDKTGQSMRIRFVGGINGTNTINHLKSLRLLAYIEAQPPIEAEPDPGEDPFLNAKTDWTPDDYYNHIALNRVEAMIQLLKPKVEEYRKKTIYLHTPVLDRTQETIQFAEGLYLIEKSIAILGAELKNPKGFISPKMGWSYNSPFTYEDANRLESNLVLLNHFIALQLNARRYCGQYITGDEGVI